MKQAKAVQGRPWPSETLGGRARYIFYTHAPSPRDQELAVLLGAAGAQVVRSLRGGEVLAYADRATLVRLEDEHPEVSVEPDLELEVSSPFDLPASRTG